MNPATCALSFVLPTAFQTPQLNHRGQIAPHRNGLHPSGIAPHPTLNQVAPLTRMQAALSDGPLSDRVRRKSPLSMPPLSSVDLERMHIDSGNIQAKVGNIEGVMKHQLLGKSQIGWCACENAPTQQRLALIEKIVKNAEQSPSADLEFTDVGAGRLLQSYLMMDELLKRDYDSITLNLIDPFYPEPICQTYSAQRNFKPQQSSFFSNPNFSRDITAAPQAVSAGFQTAALEFLDHLKEQAATLPKAKKNITVRILNSADLLPTLRERAQAKSKSNLQTPNHHQIILTDPGEPALANTAHFHMLGAGAKDALPHRDRVLVFFEREPLNSSSTKPGSQQENQTLKKGVVYAKSNVYDDIAIQDKQFIAKLTALKAPSREEIKNLFTSHYEGAHLYEDATQSFHQLLDATPDAKAIKLANKAISEGEAISHQKAQPLDEYFKESGTILGKQISLGYRAVPFQYHD